MLLLRISSDARAVMKVEANKVEDLLLSLSCLHDYVLLLFWRKLV